MATGSTHASKTFLFRLIGIFLSLRIKFKFPKAARYSVWFICEDFNRQHFGYITKFSESLN